MEKIAEKIKNQIEFWLLKSYNKEKKDISGKELFTFFDLLNSDLKLELNEKLNLRDNELPVLALKGYNKEIIVNTTERFIKLANQNIESIEYSDFERHIGFGQYIVKKRWIGRPVNVKTNGYYSLFGIKKKNGEVLEWKIPTGTPGFCFWNATKKCELIGRKYKIVK